MLQAESTKWKAIQKFEKIRWHVNNKTFVVYPIIGLNLSVKNLSNFSNDQTFRARKRTKSKQIEIFSTQKLEKGIKLSVHFEDSQKGGKNGYLDFKVIIAPNTVTKYGKANPPPTKWLRKTGYTK